MNIFKLVQLGACLQIVCDEWAIAVKPPAPGPTRIGDAYSTKIFFPDSRTSVQFNDLDGVVRPNNALCELIIKVGYAITNFYRWFSIVHINDDRFSEFDF